MKKTEIDITTERVLGHDFVILSFTPETAAQEGFCQALLMRMSEAADITFVRFKKDRATMSLIRVKGKWQLRFRGVGSTGRPQSHYQELTWIHCWPDLRPTYKRWCVLAGRIRNSVLDLEKSRQPKTLNEVPT